MNYYEMLKHPKWQKKRLEILEAAEFTCELCGSENDTLHVHHSYYEKGLALWEYPTESLRCLCETCHKEFQDLNRQLHRQLGKISLIDLLFLLGYALGLEIKETPTTSVKLSCHEVAHGVAGAWGLTAHDVIAKITKCQITGLELLEIVKAKKQSNG